LERLVCDQSISGIVGDRFEHVVGPLGAFFEAAKFIDMAIVIAPLAGYPAFDSRGSELIQRDVLWHINEV